MRRFRTLAIFLLVGFVTASVSAAPPKARKGRVVRARARLVLPVVQVDPCQGPAAPFVEGCAEPPSRFEMRRDIQEDMILAGILGGDLCWQDAQTLLQEQQAIATRQPQDGVAGETAEREQRRIEFLQDHASRNIARTRRAARACETPAEAAVLRWATAEPTAAKRN